MWRRAANLTAIIGGILVFRDPVGSGALEIIGRMLAFCLVVGGAALIPAPVRATDAGSDAFRRAERADVGGAPLSSRITQLPSSGDGKPNRARR